MQGDTIVCFKEGGPSKLSPASKAARGEGIRKNKGLLCRSCAHRITSRRQSVEIDGGHEHTFFNPAGVVYKIGCFGAAPGSHTKGAPTTEFSWFPGHSWSYAFCASCEGHLGWFFQSPSRSFFGLIVDRLAEG